VELVLPDPRFLCFKSLLCLTLMNMDRKLETARYGFSSKLSSEIIS
jgi:hypothetical protein